MEVCKKSFASVWVSFNYYIIVRVMLVSRGWVLILL